MLAPAFMAGLPPSTGSIMPVTMGAAAEAGTTPAPISRCELAGRHRINTEAVLPPT